MDAVIEAAVDRFRQARINHAEDYARLGHVAAGILVSWRDEPSLRDIAATLELSYREAALLLARYPDSRERWRDRLLRPAVVRVRQARIIFADKFYRGGLALFHW